MNVIKDCQSVVRTGKHGESLPKWSPRPICPFPTLHRSLRTNALLSPERLLSYDAVRRDDPSSYQQLSHRHRVMSIAGQGGEGESVL